MKKLPLILALVILAFACQQTERYTQNSPEIESIKAMFNAYESGDLESQRQYYAPNAQIFINTPESKPATLDDIMNSQKEEMGMFSNYSISLNEDGIEMVTTDKGETWVNVWAEWTGRLTETNQKFVVPVHETFQFVDGKIVKEYGYWDNGPIIQALMELEQSKKAATDSTAIN